MSARKSTALSWRRLVLLYATYLPVVVAVYAAVDWLPPWPAFRVAGSVVAFALLVFVVWPWLERRMVGDTDVL